MCWVELEVAKLSLFPIIHFFHLHPSLTRQCLATVVELQQPEETLVSQGEEVDATLHINLLFK